MQRINWDNFKYKLIPIDSSVKKRETKWIASCCDCQCERTITYAQAYNIVKGHYPGKCKDCIEYLPNSGQFKKSESSWNTGIEYKPKRSYDKNKMMMEITHVFGGTIYDDVIKLKMREAKLGKYGELAPRWKGGKSRASERLALMSRDEYKRLRKDCFVRDEFKCAECSTGGKLEMHHIKEWCNYPELRFEISNVVTLCKPCHKKTDNYSYKANKKKVA